MKERIHSIDIVRGLIMIIMTLDHSRGRMGSGGYHLCDICKIKYMIVRSEPGNFETICAIINDGASAYRGIIPADRWHEPYMPAAELKEQIESGVQFWIYKENDEIMGVMGIQCKNSVTLIRHAYVRTKARNKGIGSQLLKHLCDLTADPILIGTWADAKWAIEFYQKNGFRLLPEDEKNKLLLTYWTIPLRQIETSVVLASADWDGK